MLLLGPVHQHISQFSFFITHNHVWHWGKCQGQRQFFYVAKAVHREIVCRSADRDSAILNFLAWEDLRDLNMREAIRLQRK